MDFALIPFFLVWNHVFQTACIKWDESYNCRELKLNFGRANTRMRIKRSTFSSWSEMITRQKRWSFKEYTLRNIVRMELADIESSKEKLSYVKYEVLASFNRSGKMNKCPE